jgi:hypothetical protein
VGKRIENKHWFICIWWCILFLEVMSHNIHHLYFWRWCRTIYITVEVMLNKFTARLLALIPPALPFSLIATVAESSPESAGPNWCQSHRRRRSRWAEGRRRSTKDR